MEHTELYNGFLIRIERDEFSESPDGIGDTNLFLVCDADNCYIQREGFKVRAMAEIYEDTTTDKTYHAFPIHMLDIGALTTFEHQGRNGTIYVSREEFEDRAEAQRLALFLLDDWNHHMVGDVWGYVTERICPCCEQPNPNDKDNDSCWGFPGDTEYTLAEARGVVDSADHTPMVNLTLTVEEFEHIVTAVNEHNQGSDLAIKLGQLLATTPT